jgi:hypothetical protein
LSAARLQRLLHVSDEELLQILHADAIGVITGEEDTRPEVHVLLQLIQDDPPPRAWLRGRPLQLLLQRDFAGFEDALNDYRERGFTLRSRGASPPASSP